MLFTSPTIGAASGSLAGITASRNRYGNYFRARAVPVQPNSIHQQIRKAFFGLAAVRWRTLTTEQRDLWQVYADNTPLINKLGFAITLSANAMFVRCNASRVPAGLGFADDAPFDFGLPEVSPVTILPTAGTSIDVVFDANDPWVNVDGAAMLVYVGRPVGATINFYKSSFRGVESILGDGLTPPSSPFTVTSPFTLVAGQKVFVRVNVTDEQARFSQSQIVSEIVA